MQPCVYYLHVLMRSPIRKSWSICFALSEWMASNSSVQSVSAFMRMLSTPPGWSLRKRVQSYTWPWMMIQVESEVQCFLTSEMVNIFEDVFMDCVEPLFLRVGNFSSDFSKCFSFTIQPPGWFAGWVGCSNTIPISPLWGFATFVFTLNQQLFIKPYTLLHSENIIQNASLDLL